jgi:SAM-dependent methyltransferase
MPMSDPTQRFGGRVADYARHRPRYPAALVDALRREHGLAPGHVVADVGSGTGLLARLFLDAGHEVYGVEPNGEMRAAGEALLAAYPRFRSVDGRAEATGLPPASVDWVTAGQAFHWFEPEAAREEFARILRPGGHAALVWNDRRVEASAFSRGYEDLLRRFGTDYEQVRHRARQTSERDDAGIHRFFAPARCREHVFENVQRLDFQGLRGRLLSASYVPLAGHPNHAPMLAALRDLFDANARGGEVLFEHDTRLFVGRLDARQGVGPDRAS